MPFHVEKPTVTHATLTEAAYLLERSEWTIRKAVRDGELSAERIGNGAGKLFVSHAELERYRRARNTRRRRRRTRA